MSTREEDLESLWDEWVEQYHWSLYKLQETLEVVKPYLSKGRKKLIDEALKLTTIQERAELTSSPRMLSEVKVTLRRALFTHEPAKLSLALRSMLGMLRLVGPDPCQPVIVSSAMCSRGTKGCSVQHGNLCDPPHACDTHGRCWTHSVEVAEEAELPDFAEIARAILDDLRDRADGADPLADSTWLAHELAMAYEAGMTHRSDEARTEIEHLQSIVAEMQSHK